MARRRDLFARLSLDYADHPKIAGLSDAAFRAHVEMILYSRRYMTDGVIAKQIAKRWPEQALSELCTNDYETPSVVIREDGSYLLHGFSEMQETRTEIEEKRRVRADAGRKGGLAKAKAAAKQSPSKLLSKDVPETETETESNNPGRETPDELFDQWWSHYPKKVDKGQALKTFKAKLKTVDLDTLISAADLYTDQVARDGTERRFIKNPSTWLNAEPWHNEPEPPPSASPAAFDPWDPANYEHQYPPAEHRPTSSAG